MGSSITLTVSEKGVKAPNWNIKSDINGEISFADSLRFVRNSLITISQEVLREEQAQGFPKDPLRYVDGKLNKPLAAVNPLGEVRYIRKAVASTMLLRIFKEIIDRSKVVSGRYIGSHLVFFNNQLIAQTPMQLEKWLKDNDASGFKDSDAIRFVNVAPYAARLERLGVTAQRHLATFRKSKDKQQRAGAMVRKPNGAYALAYRSVRKLFKRNTTIKFQLWPGNYYGLQRYDVFKTGPSKGSPYLYPSIVVYLKESGVELQ